MPNVPQPTPTVPVLPKQPPAVGNPTPVTQPPVQPAGMPVGGPVAAAPVKTLNNAKPLPTPVIPSLARQVAPGVTPGAPVAPVGTVANGVNASITPPSFAAGGVGSPVSAAQNPGTTLTAASLNAAQASNASSPIGTISRPVPPSAQPSGMPKPIIPMAPAGAGNGGMKAPSFGASPANTPQPITGSASGVTGNVNPAIAQLNGSSPRTAVIAGLQPAQSRVNQSAVGATSGPNAQLAQNSLNAQKNPQAVRSMAAVQAAGAAGAVGAAGAGASNGMSAAGGAGGAKPSAGGAPGAGGTGAGNGAGTGSANGIAEKNPAIVKPVVVKQSPFRFLPFVVVGVLLLALGAFLFTRFFGGSNTADKNATQSAAVKQQVTLTYWGLWEPEGVMANVIADYEAANPGVKIQYQQQSYKDYRERLQAAIATGKGPDIFRFHASWVPMMTRELSAVPANVYSRDEFAANYYQVASDQLSVGNDLVGIPLMYDGLALYYNTDILRTANVSPPTTWAELKTLAKQLTIRSANKKLERAGVALGNASNVEHFSDILALLILQNGGDLQKPNTLAVQQALQYYTDFYTVDKDWDETLPSSTVAFARGEAAMMLAPSWRAHDIKALNPNLNFGIAPAPQLSERKVAWASYWAEGVNQQSKYKNESWKFLKYLSSPEVLKKFYSSASQVRPFGEIYPLRSMTSEVPNDPYVTAYLADAPLAQGGFLSSYTHDNGINDQIIKYYTDAVNALISGKTPQEVTVVLEQGTTQVLRQFGLAPAEAPVVPAQ